MSQQFLFPNFYNTTLSASLSSTATTMSVTTSTGLPTLLSGQVIPLILTPKSSPGSIYEIVYVTGISGTTLTIERGMEGTSAQTWNSGDIVLCGPTGESVAPVRSWHAPVASETLPVGNDLLVMPGTLGAAITLTLPSTGMVVGNKYRIYGSASAYAVTVALSNSTGSPFIHLPDGTEVYSYVLPASSSQNGIELEWDGTNWKGFNFGVMNIPNATASNQPVNLGQMPYLTLEQFGGKADGVTDNTSAYLSALAALPSTGGTIVLGSGTYLFDSAVSFSFPASSYGLTITGQGSGATTVFFKGGINGFSFTMNSPQNYIHFNGFSVTTDNSSTTNTVTAIEISQSVPEGSFLQSSFVDMSIYGNSGPANGEFWSYGIYANGVSDINFINDIFYGTGGNGIGIFLTGNTSVSPYYGIVFNITSCGFFALNTGLVYGSYIQGVTVSQSNFTNCEYGISNDSNNIGNDQLAINNSQFNVAETAINLQGNLNDLLLTGNMIIVGTSTSSFGVFLSTGIRATIVGNDFEQGSGSTVGNTGIIVSGAFTVGVVTGNVFQNLTYGVSLGTSTSGWNVQANVYNKVTTTVTNSGSGNSIGVATD